MTRLICLLFCFCISTPILAVDVKDCFLVRRTYTHDGVLNTRMVLSLDGILSQGEWTPWISNNRDREFADVYLRATTVSDIRTVTPGTTGRAVGRRSFHIEADLTHIRATTGIDLYTWTNGSKVFVTRLYFKDAFNWPVLNRSKFVEKPRVIDEPAAKDPDSSPSDRLREAPRRDIPPDLPPPLK